MPNTVYFGTNVLHKAITALAQLQKKQKIDVWNRRKSRRNGSLVHASKREISRTILSSSIIWSTALIIYEDA